MISIKPSNIPEYLRGSCFFANLSEDDEEVSVPGDCCKVDTSVADVSELDYLLRTLRFWGVDKLPATAITFMLSKPLNAWEHIASLYERDLSCVADLLEIVNCSRECQVCKTVEKDNLDILMCLLEQGYPVELKSHDSAKKFTSHAVNIAARKGNLEILKLLQQFNCPYHQDTSMAAALSGDIASLKFVVMNGCPVADDLVNFVFFNGNAECLKYVHETVGCPWTYNLFHEFGYRSSDTQYNEQGMIQCLQYAQEHGWPGDPKACEMCAIHGLPLLLRHLHESGCPWSAVTVAMAARYGHFHCVQYAVENGCPVADFIFTFAVLSGNVSIIQYLHDNGLPWPDDILSGMRHNDGTEDKVVVCLVRACKLGCPYDPDTCYYASKHGWYDILVEAHQNGVELYHCCAKEAAEHGHLNCLVYVHEHGCAWDEGTTTFALKNGQYACLKYAIINGCPATTATMEKYHSLVANGDL